MSPWKFVAFSVPLCVLSGCITVAVMFIKDISREPEIGVNISSVDWLPASAREISYFRSYGYTAYEFKIKESEFRDWAKMKAHGPGAGTVFYQPVDDVAEIETARFIRVDRYNLLLPLAGAGYDENQPTRNPEEKRRLKSQAGSGARNDEAAQVVTQSVMIEIPALPTGRKILDSGAHYHCSRSSKSSHAQALPQLRSSPASALTRLPKPTSH